MVTTDSRFFLTLGAVAGALCLLVLSPLQASAQYNTGHITGAVRDEQGAAVPGARVIAEHASNGHKVERITDQQGVFLLSALQIGEYVISVETPGFKRVVHHDVVVELGQTLDIDFVLQVGGLNENVTVTAELPLLRTDSAELSQIIRGDQVVRLPLNGRQFLQLALLTDNVVVPPGGTRGSALQQAGSLFNVAGQRSGHNIYLLDGVKVTDEYFNNMVVSLSPDAIQEFKIQKSQYPAEFGGKASALVNVATKSGGNQFHGILVGLGRTSIFDAHNFFDDHTSPVPPLTQHQLGASLGGPLLRERSFFFLNYEGQRARRSITQTFSVPSAALRDGDFSAQNPVCDPLAPSAAAGVCTPFANNLIPRERLDPIAEAFLAKVPLPNKPGEVQNLTSVESQRTTMNQASLRLDHRLGSDDQLFGRFTLYGVSDDQPFGTSVLNETLVPGFGRRVTTRSRNLALGHTHVLGADVVNELRFGFLNARGGQYSQNAGTDFASAVGLNGVTHDPRDVGYPQISLSGLYSTMGDPTSFTTRNDTSAELYENLLVRRGSHAMKFGAYVFHLKFRPESPDLARGSFAYSGQFSRNALADFLLGYPATAQATTGRADEDARTTWFHVYAQDEWRVSRDVTVNAGLRSELNAHVQEVDNRLSSIDPEYPGGRFVIASDASGTISDTAEPLLSSIPIPYATSADAGWDPSLLRPSYTRLAPRIGIAWQAPGHSGTVVRAAFGIFLNQWAYSVQQAFAKNLPFFSTKTVSMASDVRVPTDSTASILTTPALGTVGGSIMDWDYRVEYNQTYSVDVQQLLTPRTSVEVSLLASRTVGADSSTIRNVPAPGPGAIAARRPIPQLGAINAIRWDGWGLYHSATVRLEHRMTDGLALSANYTWSKSMDDASDPGGTTNESNLPQNVNDMDAERALSSYDHRHRMVANGSYEFPWFATASGWRHSVGSGWRLSGIVTLESGAPFTVNLGTDRANVGPGPAQRPNVVGDPNLGSGQTPQRWFDTSAFSLPDPFTFGNAGRNIVFGPGYANTDVTLQKTAELSGKLRLELRWEVFNLFNRANFNTPNRIAFTPNFGRIFSAGPPRQMQFGAKLLF